MNKYRIVATDPSSGKSQIINIDALDEDVAQAQVRQRGLEIKSVNLLIRGTTSHDPSAAARPTIAQLSGPSIEDKAPKSKAKAGLGWGTGLFVLWVCYRGIQGVNHSSINNPAQAEATAPYVPPATPAPVAIAAPAEPVPPAEPTESSETSFATEVEHHAFRLLDVVIKRQNLLTRETDMAQLIKAANCSTPADLAANKAKLTNAIQSIANIRAEMSDIAQKSRDTLQTKLTIPAVQQKALQDFGSNVQASVDTNSHVFFFNQEIYAEAESMLSLLQDSQSLIKVENGAFTFGTQESLDAFNASLARIDALAFKQRYFQDKTNRLSSRIVSASDASPTLTQGLGTPSPQSMVVDLSTRGILINEKPLTFPIDFTHLTEILGKPSRSAPGEVLVHTWDTLGIFAVQPRGSSVTCIGVSLNPVAPGGPDPKQVFSGKLTVESIPVTDLQTPRTLNRQLSQRKFVPVEGYSDWELRLGPCNVSFPLPQNGLSDTFFITAPTPEPSTATDSSNTKPRF